MHTKVLAAAVALVLTAAGCTAGGSGGASHGAGGPGPGAAPTTTKLGGMLPSRRPAAGRLPPLADTSAATKLDLGFPTDLLLPQVLFLPTGATVHVSSVTSSGGRTQLTLAATVHRSCSGLLVALRRWFTGGGFTEASTRETATRADLTFRRDDGTVTVATTTTGTTCVLAELGVLTAVKTPRR